MGTQSVYRGSGATVGWKQRVGVVRTVMRFVDGLFGAVSTAVILAVLVTVPVVQFFALGYLLNAAGRLARTGKLSKAFVGVRQMSQIGQALLGVWLVTLPLRFLVSLYLDARLIDATTADPRPLYRVTQVVGALTVVVVAVALSQGGRLRYFFRPIRAAKLLYADICMGSYGQRSWQRVRAFFGAFAIPRVFSLGVRGYVGAAVLLLVPTTLIAIGARGPMTLVGGAMMVTLLLYLPFLQVHFAAHGQLSRFVQFQSIRYLFKRAPVAFFFALLATLLFALPLYLLKIELVPRDALWLPAAVFIITIFPAKLLIAWAYYRGAKREAPRHWLSRNVCRLLMLPVAVLYTVALFFTQFTGWHGVFGLYEQHAFLLPVPF